MYSSYFAVAIIKMYNTQSGIIDVFCSTRALEIVDLEIVTFDINLLHLSISLGCVGFARI